MTEEVDYGYGDGQPDYGYGDGAPDDVKPKPSPEPDYGYGEASPMDYGYGDAAPASNNTTSGHAQPSMDYGYGDEVPAENNSMDYSDGAHSAQLPQDRRPKRRCSVTKYTIENDDKESPLTAHTRINDFRNGGARDIAKRTPPTSEESGTGDKSAEEDEPKTKVKKKGMMHRIRKRLSIVT